LLHLSPTLNLLVFVAAMTSVAADDSYDSSVEQADGYVASLLAVINSDLHRVRRSPHHHHHGGTSSSS